jgi:tetraacyldisaccharide 4'-kinase
VETYAYPDHHAYSPTEIVQLKARASERNATLITTEKDFVRLDSSERDRIEVLPVRVVFEDRASFEQLLEPLFTRTSAIE